MRASALPKCGQQNARPGGIRDPGGEGSAAVGSASPIAKRHLHGKPAFAEWLARARVSRGPAGDLVGDLLADGRRPEFRDLEHLLSYLRSRRACSSAVKAAPSVWARYRGWRS